MKRLWITSLDKDEAGVRRLMAAARGYGLPSGGHFWIDDLAKLAWSGAREDLGHADTGAWAILASPESLAKLPVRLGLALLALDVQSRKGPNLPILLLAAGADPGNLPTPLRGAQALRLEDPALAAKLVAAVNRPPAPVAADYRLALYPTQGLGLWVEVGPGPGTAWSGALLGASEGTIDAHGVGPRGRLPERCTLEYPMKGLQVDLDGAVHTAWAVRNALDDGHSYFLRVNGLGGSLVFGPFPEGDAADLYRIQLT